MRQFIFTLFTIALISSCTNEKPEETPTSDQSDLNNKIAQLEKENARKDSMINESLVFFSEIKTNLEAIDVKKEEIRILSSNPEITPDDKKWILEQIRHINYLREENAKKVVQLNRQLKNNGLKIQELENMIQELVQNIQSKDEQISVLQGELGSMDKAYSKLFDAYQEKAELVDDLTDEMNTAYFSYGTEEELIKNQVIEKKNGFIGIGKRIKLSDNFNEKYFAKTDIREQKEIFVEGTDLKFITDHPSKSYDLVPVGKNTKIKILDAGEFWKVSKYMVVIVEIN